MHTLSALELHRHFVQGDLSAQSIAEHFLSRIQRYDANTDAFLEVFHEEILQQAKELDQKKKEGKPLGALAGVPIAVKDNIHMQGKITTCGSLSCANYRAVFEATAIQSLRRQDALFIGKTNMDEFAMGSSTESSAFKKTKNPWNLSCTPGGSSGGSSAAVAARYCPLSLGSDTGGSIRQPASFCNIVGFKPTYGRVSRYGLVAFASSLDQIGPFATTVEDIAYIMETLGCHCPKDATSLKVPQEPYLSRLQKPVQGLKVGVPYRFLQHLSAQAKQNFDAALITLQDLGACLVDVSLDTLQHSVAIYYILATAEASTNLARFDGIRYGLRSCKATTLEEVYELSKQEGFGAEVKNRILLGTYVLSSGYKDAYYKKAQKVRALMIQQLNEAFTSCDLIAMPSTPVTPFQIGSIQDPLQMYLQDIYTIPANMAGLPAISVPSGKDQEGKPFGLQLMGPIKQDGLVLQMAHHFEMATQYAKQLPPLFASEVST